MRVECFDSDIGSAACENMLPVRLFAQPPRDGWASCGQNIAHRISVERLDVPTAAKDFLRLSMGVIAADRGVLRTKSQNNWNRRIELVVPVEDPTLWNNCAAKVEAMLQFLSGDLWSVQFKATHGQIGRDDDKRRYPDSNEVSLLSGGADSLVGALDLAARKATWLAVSQTSSETKVQRNFAEIASAAEHFPWTHGVNIPYKADGTERARSMGFFGLAVVAATSTRAYHQQESVRIHGSENGLISLNPPLTDARIGSASTRTTHPAFITQLQDLLHSVGLNVELKNEYQYKTKGEMFSECLSPKLLRSVVQDSMSCGKSGRINMHCGRCVPCIIRRSAFHASGIQDLTKYQNNPTGGSSDFWESDDVRCAVLGSGRYSDTAWLKCSMMPSLAKADGIDRAALIDVASRGLREVHNYLSSVYP
ncbi:Qat anti-phage system QueC-like protein QatC [Rhodopirellula europaea]|uniref:7-cyano-7-deazaguanine synthase n=1 Tax=Rhodopirellula europaea SH398 TaxID=1263868 RepID=M5S0G6_9BACT|nr:Qat anti-phage system QueC-like protein QatC [Rhodopirellula europaea]EMI25098.1 hypothetical protein RESH_04323 [Rhodopirellula europaea SH398]